MHHRIVVEIRRCRVVKRGLQSTERGVGCSYLAIHRRQRRRGNLIRAGRKRRRRSDAVLVGCCADVHRSKLITAWSWCMSVPHPPHLHSPASSARQCLPPVSPSGRRLRILDAFLQGLKPFPSLHPWTRRSFTAYLLRIFPRMSTEEKLSSLLPRHHNKSVQLPDWAEGAGEDRIICYYVHFKSRYFS